MMPRDFTSTMYERLLNAVMENGYSLMPFEDYLQSGPQNGKTFILRHDVDKLPDNALRIAALQNKLGLRGTYYFRVVKQSFDASIIKQIAALGHEIGYHYEDLALCNGSFDKAIEHFRTSLQRLRRFYPVRTICMHGSPLSKWDNRLLWTKYDYRDFDIIAEPYFDIDFREVFYLTDTGRRWNANSVSVRDKVNSGFNYIFNSTLEIVSCFNRSQMPDLILQNIHPQRWSNRLLPWATEWALQNAKNVIKRRFLIAKTITSEV